MVEKGLKWLVVFAILKYCWDVQEENENHKKFIITSASSSRIQKYCWALLMLHYHRNTVKLTVMLATPEIKSNQDVVKSATPEILSNSEAVMSATPEILWNFVHSIVKLLETSEFNSCRKTHQWLVITECQTTTRNIWLTQTEKNLPKNLSFHIAFINGGVNFKGFALKEHTASDCHKVGLE